ncbi:transmembrane channel-like protein 5 isoform X3 [Rhinatrema bivittatum]|uniref:transmembrane channel-like protein 5 isoform X3 n=1 Tax=Rhinatrema bivittatum TaxID=194408 RepID=UPI001127C25D|nr:transmembrane channel-like protein 5 isoform X3 [Rhinatrema bivittatum]
MSYYNEGFDNDDYHNSDTLEIDRRFSPQTFSIFQENPHSSYDDPSEERQRRMEYAEVISMTSVQPVSLHVQNASAAPYTEPHNGGLSNPGFENEPDFESSPRSIIYSQDRYSDSYSRGQDESSKGTIGSPSRIHTMYENTFPSTRTTLGQNIARRPENKREQLVVIKKLALMSNRERAKAIKKLPLILNEKQEIRKIVQLMIKKESKTLDIHTGCCSDCLHNTALSFQRFKETLLEIKQALQLWQKTLKVIGSRFGTSILSYFIFLRWLLTFNIFSFIINFSFITIPQFEDSRPNNLSFTGLELLTGSGYFEQTVLYYGFYTNSTIKKNVNLAPYNMQLAYIFIIGLYLVICFFVLVYSMAKSFRDNFINPAMYTGNATKLLCSWDFSITNDKAVKLAQQNMSTRIKEDLSEKQEKLVLTGKQQIVVYLIHLAAWIISTGISIACCAAVYILSVKSSEGFSYKSRTSLADQGLTLLQPFLISVINLVMPFVFSLSEFVEKFNCPRHKIYVSVIRNTFLKISIIGVLCYYWFRFVAESDTKCWESLVGQELYRLVIIDFIFSLLGSFFNEFLQRIIGTSCCKTLGKPEFDIARNVLDLIYAQTLVWIGIYFSPLLPLIQIIKLFILFYIKKVSLRMNCLPPRKAWRAAQMTTVFIFLLFFPSFIGVVVAIGVTIFRLKPSGNCGPFQGLDVPFDAISNWVSSITGQANLQWVVWIYNNLIQSELFFFLLTLLALTITYLYWQIVQGRKIMIKLLQQQIVNEGKDKMLLLQKLRKLQETDDLKLHHSPSDKLDRQASIRMQDRMQVCQADTEHQLRKQSGSLALAMWAKQKAIAEEQEQCTNMSPPSALALALKARQEAEEEEDS